MIKNWIVTGDLHGQIDDRFIKVSKYYEPSETVIIILGDTGANYYLNKKDKKFKEQLCSLGFTFYCVKGNHEARPDEVNGMQGTYDPDVEGFVYFEPEFPYIKYFQEFGTYYINDYKTLVIGGAYSVDKEYRILRGWQWFPTEQLNEDEMAECMKMIEEEGREYDLVLSHTCPYSWMPIDLFLPFIDQSKVDNRTEYFLEEVKEKIQFKKWCYGHYHADRSQNPQARMFFADAVDIHMLIEKSILKTDWSEKIC